MNDITGLSGLGVGELMQKYVEANMEVQNHIIASSFGKEGQEAADNLRLLENELLRRLTLNKELVDALEAASLEMEGFGGGNPTVIKVRAALAKVSER